MPLAAVEIPRYYTHDFSFPTTATGSPFDVMLVGPGGRAAQRTLLLRWHLEDTVLTDVLGYAASLLVVSKQAPVAPGWMVILTVGTAAPECSVGVPVSVARSSWARRARRAVVQSAWG